MTGTPAGAVWAFHDAFNLPLRTVPSQVHPEESALRVRLQKEETRELEQAALERDLVEIADALADIVYVAYGSALTWGIDLDAVIAEVHRSNMTKLDADGKPLYRQDGKVVKGEQYEPPKIARVLGVDRGRHTLIVGTWSSKCGNCGRGCDPSEKSHETLLGHGVEPGERGCGVIFEYISSEYTGLDLTGCRPDLEPW